MPSRSLLLPFLFVIAACGTPNPLGDAAAPMPDHGPCGEAHHCLYPACCDPVCQVPSSSVTGCPAGPCPSAGYDCLYFESACTCQADGTWKWVWKGTPPDMGTHD